MTPTGRVAAAFAGIGLAALLVPAWLAVAAAIVLITAIGVDAWVVRKPPAVERMLHRVLSRGAASPLRVRARPTDRRTVVLRQPAMTALEVDVSNSENELEGRLVPRQRGRHELPPVASASVGPLGLARVLHPPGPLEQVRVYPDLVSAHALIVRLRRRLVGHPSGLARGPLGLGTDFESVREYTPDDDIRQLNWRATARMGRPMSNQYRVERDRDIVCLLDAGRLMAAPLHSRTVLDAALDAVVLLALASDELGDRCGAIAFDDGIRRSLVPRHLGGRHVIESLFDLEPRLVDSDFELAFTRVGGSRRALVLVFTDLVDEAAARSLLAAIPMLARRHAVVIASPIDSSLEEFVSRPPRAPEDVAAAVVAFDVLEARAQAAARLRGAGASVIEAPADRLAKRCLDTYLSLKSRAPV